MTLDVLIPVHNAADTLAQAVQSALDIPGARVILVDDGSTDGSGALCDEWASEHRVQVLHQPNRGVSAARNAAMAQASAPFVTFLDADDVLLPAMGAMPDAMGRTDAAQGLTVKSGGTNAPEPPAMTLQPGRDALAAALEDPTRHLHLHGWIFRRELLTERFDEALTLGEDGEWMLRTLSHARMAGQYAAPVYRYTLRMDSAVHAANDAEGKYRQTLQAAQPTLSAMKLPAQAALYRLTHLLLILTHGVCRSGGMLTQCRAIVRLRGTEPFRLSFREVRLKGHSPRIWTLRLLRWRLYPLVWLAVKYRQRSNRSQSNKS